MLSRDIRPDKTRVPVREAVAEVRVAFELVLSRFVDRRAVGWPSFAADNGAFEALVLGEPIERAQLGALADELVVSVDGEEAARRLLGEDGTDPDDRPRRSGRDGAGAAHDASEGQHRLDRHSLEAIRGGLASADISARFLGTELRIRTEARPDRKA